jgi:hypothetical protein
MERWTGLTIAIVVLVLGTTVTPAAATTLGDETGQVGDLESDLVTIRATVAETGTADFRIQYAIELSDENDSQAFADLAGDIEANESRYLGRFADRLNATVDAAESATGRDMTIGSYGVSTETTTLGKEYGLVTYTATWTGFANATADRIEVGDALQGLFIDADTRLELQWTTEYQLESVTPAPTSSNEGEVVWSGPREFETREPRVVLTPVPTTTTHAAPTTTTQAPPTDEGGLPVWLVGVGVVLAGLLAAAWYRRSGQDGGSEPKPPGDSPGDTGQAASGPAPPSELLSNEERVEQYLESVGGRAKQQEIVDALDWTEAKTSQVLSEMAEAGTIEKFRIGRENVVKLGESGDKSE